MDGTILVVFIVLQAVFYLTGLVYAILTYSRRELPVWALVVSVLLFFFPVAIPLVCFYGQRAEARKRGKAAPAYALAIRAGWLLVLFSVICSGAMSYFCRLAYEESDPYGLLAVCCSQLASLLAVWLVLWLIGRMRRMSVVD